MKKGIGGAFLAIPAFSRLIPRFAICTFLVHGRLSPVHSILLLSSSLLAQPSLLFRAAPAGEVLNDSLIAFQVSPIPPATKLPDSCALFRSPSPVGDQLAGHTVKLDAVVSAPADSQGSLFRIRPSDSGAAGPKLGLGFHYIVAACGDGKDVTPEIPLLVVTRQAATIATPKAVETSASPNISWAAVPGVPAYHLLLSDQALEIDAEKGTVGGASVIWQAITTKTSIAYGTPDPSGNFSKVSPPPLSPGVTYNLVVLNNYDGRSALATSSKAQALKLFSIQAPAAPLSKPKNLEPAPGRTLGVSTDSAVAFRWTASKSSAGAANTYRMFIYSLEEQDGSEILLPIWSGELTDTAVILDAKRTLLSNRYFWKVFAVNEAGVSVVGDTTSFTYRNDVQVLSISVTGPSSSGPAAPLGDVRIAVTPLDGSADALPLFTPASGRVDKTLTVGAYSLEFTKDGYVTQKRTVTLDAAGPFQADQSMPAAASRILGRAVDAGGLGLDNVRVTASGDKAVSALTDAQGYFLLGVAAGAYAVSLFKADYVPPAEAVLTLKAAEALDMGRLVMTQAKGSLSGTVSNDKGAPMSECQVMVKTPAGALVRTLLTDGKGSFSAFLTPGSYVVSASRTGFTSEEKPVRLTDAVSLQLQLVPGASVLKGKVSIRSYPTAGAPTSSPEAGAALELRHVFSGAVQKTESDLRGEYSLSADTGTYMLKASRAGRAPPDSVLVRIDKVRSTVQKDLELLGYASVQGTLTLVPAAPVDPSAITVSLLRLPSLEVAASVQAFASGGAVPGGAPVPAFSLAGVRDGTYKLACGVPGYGLSAEPTLTIKDGVWITGLALILNQATKSITLNLRRGNQVVPGSVKLVTPLQTEVRAGTKVGPAAPGTYVLDATPDSSAFLPVKRFSFVLPLTGAADTTLSLAFPFAHVPPADPIVFANQVVQVVLETQARVDSAWIVYGYGAPADTFRVPPGQLEGFVDEPKKISFNPGPQGGLLTYYFIVRSGSLAYVNDSPARRFQARIEPSAELAFLRVSGGDSLPLPARSRVALDVHAYDAAGRRIDTAVDARGKVTWKVDDVFSTKAESRRGRALTLATGAAPVPAQKPAAKTAAQVAPSAIAIDWDSLRVTVVLDNLTRTLSVPARVVPARINKLVLTSSLGETPEIPTPAPFGLFVAGYDTTTTPPTPLVPTPAFTLDPPEAGTVTEMEMRIDPRFIGPLRIAAVHINADGSAASTELGASRDSSLRGLNVGQTLQPADTARLFVHDRQFEMRVPDSALSSQGQAIVRLYRRQVAKSFSSGVAEVVAGRLYEISNPSGASFGKPLRLNLGVPPAFRDRRNALRRFEVARLDWQPLPDSASADTTSFGDASIASDATFLDGNYYGLLGVSRPLSAGSLEIVPNPFSPLIMATRDGNTEYGTRIRFRPESNTSSEVTVTIRIYNMDAELVRTVVDHRTVPKAPTDFYWDGKADGGRWARNGRYLVKISLKSTGSRETRHVVKPVVVFR